MNDVTMFDFGVAVVGGGFVVVLMALATAFASRNTDDAMEAGGFMTFCGFMVGVILVMLVKRNPHLWTSLWAYALLALPFSIAGGRLAAWLHSQMRG